MFGRRSTVRRLHAALAGASFLLAWPKLPNWTLWRPTREAERLSEGQDVREKPEQTNVRDQSTTALEERHRYHRHPQGRPNPGLGVDWQPVEPSH